jgi:hypothetical protein
MFASLCTGMAWKVIWNWNVRLKLSYNWSRRGNKKWWWHSWTGRGQVFNLENESLKKTSEKETLYYFPRSTIYNCGYSLGRPISPLPTTIPVMWNVNCELWGREKVDVMWWLRKIVPGDLGDENIYKAWRREMEWNEGSVIGEAENSIFILEMRHVS